MDDSHAAIPDLAGGRATLQVLSHQAMLDRGLWPDFEPAVRAQVATLTGAPLTPEAGIRDLRALPWSSIDNDDSRDLDQVEVAEPLAGGAIRLRVAIADVDALVPAGSPADLHAGHNTTSVYTAGQIYPMLPERLSTDLTSLAPGQERLAVVVEMTVAPDGGVTAPDLYRARLVNRAKLAYDAVAAWLDGRGPAPAPLAALPGLDEQLRLQDRVAQALRQVRHAHGALSLETIQSRAVFEGDALRDLLVDEKNRAKALIEDLMIAANGVTARFLEQKGFTALRRVVRSPRRWDRIVALAAELHEPLPATPDAAALNGFLGRRRIADPERFPDLSLSVIKLMGAGEYAVDVPGEASPGHFGLAVRDYTHSTAPNRRYPDLVTQRLLKAALAGRPTPYPVEALRDLARRCTEQEDAAAKVERQVSKSAAALLLRGRIGERFDAIVTGVSDGGTWVRISTPPVEGRVVRGFQGLDVGARTRVELVRTDVARGFIDFARAG